MRPMIPSWIRSSSDRPCPWYFFAIETTRRRFELTIRSFASLSPRSTRFASSTSSAAVSSGYRPASLRKSCSASVVAVARSPLTYVVDAVFVEVERGREVVEGAQVDAALLLPALEQGSYVHLTHARAIPSRRVA